MTCLVQLRCKEPKASVVLAQYPMNPGSWTHPAVTIFQESSRHLLVIGRAASGFLQKSFATEQVAYSASFY